MPGDNNVKCVIMAPLLTLCILDGMLEARGRVVLELASLLVLSDRISHQGRLGHIMTQAPALKLRLHIGSYVLPPCS